MIDTDVRSYLLTQGAVTAIVGSAGVFVEHATDGKSPPYCVVAQDDGNPEQHAGGVSGLSRATVDIACYGTTADKAGQLAKVVSAAVAGKQATMGTANVRSSLVIGQRREKSAPKQGDQTGFPVAYVTVEAIYS